MSNKQGDQVKQARMKILLKVTLKESTLLD